MSKIKFYTFKEHAQKKNMWLGSDLINENQYWVLNPNTNKFEKETINVSEALLKCFDEIIVNASDQYIRSQTYSKPWGPVSQISVNFDPKTGRIQIENDGKGIPIYFDSEINQWSVQAVISKEFSGTNFDEEENPDRVVGGVNGLGIKLINIKSKYFEIETVDMERKKFYSQICENNMDIIHTPKVLDLPRDQLKSYTRITFIPDYGKLCKTQNQLENPDWINLENLEKFQKLIHFRTCQISCFISNLNYRTDKSDRIDYKNKARVWFNGKLIYFPSISSFLEKFNLTEWVEFELSGPEIRFPWKVCLAKANSPETRNQTISLINSIYLKGGSHINLLMNQIFSGLKPEIEKLSKDTNSEFKESKIRKLFFIMDVRQLPLPQFSSQTKEQITISSKELIQMKKQYQIPEKIIQQIWKMIRDLVEYKLLQDNLKKSQKKKKTPKSSRDHEKAEKYGPKSLLFIPEGNSAAGSVRDIIMSKNSPIPRNLVGMYNIQGVPPNACKLTREIEIYGEKKIFQDRKLQNNISFDGLYRALGLDYNFTYYAGPDPEKKKKGDEEFRKLNYGSMVICVDQDLDGIGNICSLIIVYILIFWPELIKRGFVKRLQTPIIRVYLPKNLQLKTDTKKSNKSRVFEFYSLSQYQTWIETNWGSEELVPETVKKGINYYKGLGGHSPEEIRNMGRNLPKNMITYTPDECMELKMKLFYGEETGGRKEILLTPVELDYTPEMLKEQKIPISYHFEIESKSFQLYFMKRKLKSSIDGLLPSQRKALAGARIMYKKESKSKVYQLTGYVAKKMFYQHGDMSMNELIIKMAQNFTGSNNIPPLVAISNGFGSRVLGRGESAGPRYISLKYNKKVMDLIFPPEDDWLLEYNFEDGYQAEPVYYVPIIPYSILETTTTTGVGWKIDVWARNWKKTLENLKKMILFESPSSGFLGEVWIQPGMKIIIGKIGSGKSSTEICLGSYEWKDSETVLITQLPLKIWSKNFRCEILGINPKTGKTEDLEGNPLTSKEFVEDVIDRTNNDRNEIYVKFKPGSLEQIQTNWGNEYLDPIEDYLGLYQTLNSHLNMIGAEQAVHEFPDYESVMDYWFKYRRDLYIQRILRQKKILELRISYYSEILRFILLDETKEINIDKKDREERIRILENFHFRKFNKTNLISPKYLKLEELEKHILELGASYRYIDEITKGMTEKKYIEDLEKNIQNMKARLEELETKNWKTVWLEELEELENVISEGIKTKWLFDDSVEYEFQ